ncbi:MAG: tryptophan--tRNA ligase [archaeon]
MELNPWESFEVKDYNKLMKKFGIEKLDTKKIPEKHPFFDRGIIFGHKDFGNIASAIKNKKPWAMMTGLMPSGKFHFGHKMVADEIIYFQKLGAECYIAVADIESYLTRGISLEDARKTAIEEYLINYIALGLKPAKTKFYFQSNGSSEYNNLSKFVSKKTTYNELKSIYGDISPEKMVSTFTQVADILSPQLDGPKPVIVPVGVDQLPHISLTRDIANRMKLIPPSATFHKLMPGLKGGKLSSSDPSSAIFLTDSPNEIKKRINKYALSGGQKTLEEHRKKGGNPDVDISYQWLTYIEEDDKKLKQIYNDYKSGKLLSGELKAILIEKLTKFLEQHQKKRELAKKQVDKFLKE